MNLEQNGKKKIVIGVLAVGVIALAGGLYSYMGKMNNNVPAVQETVAETETEAAVTVKQIAAETTTARTEPETMEADVTNAETQEQVAEPETIPETTPAPAETTTAAVSRTEARPRTPEQATAPAAPPTDPASVVPVENPDPNGECQPEHTEPAAEQPQGGDTNSSGAVYVPGFGYVEPSGSVEGSTSYTDGDWDKQIGTMD